MDKQSNKNSSNKTQGNGTSKTSGNQYSQKKENSGQSVNTSEYSDSVSNKSGKS